MPRIIEPDSKVHIEQIRSLFIEYWEWLQFDPCFQDFEQELKDLPGAYAPPSGCILLAVEADQAVGCVALRPIGDGICEMKRLYIQPPYRGRGLGRQLVGRIIDEAKARDYRAMRLDTLPVMHEALALYDAFGFIETEPYTEHRAPGAKYLELTLSNEEK